MPEKTVSTLNKEVAKLTREIGRRLERMARTRNSRERSQLMSRHSVALRQLDQLRADRDRLMHEEQRQASAQRKQPRAHVPPPFPSGYHNTASVRRIRKQRQPSAPAPARTTTDSETIRGARGELEYLRKYKPVSPIDRHRRTEAAHRAVQAIRAIEPKKAKPKAPAKKAPRPRLVAVTKLTDDELRAEVRRAATDSTPGGVRRFEAAKKELQRRDKKAGNGMNRAALRAADKRQARKSYQERTGRTLKTQPLRGAPVTKKLPGRAARLRAEFEREVLASYGRRRNGSGFAKIRDVRADVMARLRMDKDIFTRELNSMRDRNDKNKSGRYELHYEMNEDDWRNFTGKPPSYSHIWHGHQYDFISIMPKPRN